MLAFILLALENSTIWLSWEVQNCIKVLWYNECTLRAGETIHTFPTAVLIHQKLWSPDSVGKICIEHTCALGLTCSSWHISHLHAFIYGMFFSEIGKGDERNIQAERRWREKWWAHTLALYIVSVQTDVSLSSLCVGSRCWLSKLFLSLAGCM